MLVAYADFSILVLQIVTFYAGDNFQSGDNDDFEPFIEGMTARDNGQNHADKPQMRIVQALTSGQTYDVTSYN